MANCPSCNKFAGLELQDPEENSADFDAENGHINIDLRIVRNSSCCGDEMKDYDFNLEGDVDEEIVKAHQGDGHELSAEFTHEGTEEGGSRYKKSYFGVRSEVEIRCSCQKEGSDALAVIELDDKVQASDMNELN